MTRLLTLTLLALFVTASAQVNAPSKSRYGNVVELMDRMAKGDPPVLMLKFAESEACTVNLLAAKGELKPHYHAKSDETVVVSRGSGTFVLDGVRHDLKPGDVMYIARGTVHSFVPVSDDVVVVSVFSPKFDPSDRVFVDGR